MNDSHGTSTGGFVQLQRFGQSQFIVGVDNVLNPCFVQGFVIGAKGDFGGGIRHLAQANQYVHSRKGVVNLGRPGWKRRRLEQK
jgi:hypothetical protein